MPSSYRGFKNYPYFIEPGVDRDLKQFKYFMISSTFALVGLFCGIYGLVLSHSLNSEINLIHNNHAQRLKTVQTELNTLQMSYILKNIDSLDMHDRKMLMKLAQVLENQKLIGKEIQKSDTVPEQKDTYAKSQSYPKMSSFKTEKGAEYPTKQPPKTMSPSTRKPNPLKMKKKLRAGSADQALLTESKAETTETSAAQALLMESKVKTTETSAAQALLTESKAEATKTIGEESNNVRGTTTDSVIKIQGNTAGEKHSKDVNATEFTSNEFAESEVFQERNESKEVNSMVNQRPNEHLQPSSSDISDAKVTANTHGPMINERTNEQLQLSSSDISNAKVTANKHDIRNELDDTIESEASGNNPNDRLDAIDGTSTATGSTKLVVEHIDRDTVHRSKTKTLESEVISSGKHPNEMDVSGSGMNVRAIKESDLVGEPSDGNLKELNLKVKKKTGASLVTTPAMPDKDEELEVNNEKESHEQEHVGNFKFGRVELTINLTTQGKLNHEPVNTRFEIGGQEHSKDETATQ